MNEKKDNDGFDVEAVFNADSYLHFYTKSISDEVTDKQFNFLVRELDLVQDTSVLDLACGHGRHANKLAQHGCKVTGMDINPEFIKIAKINATEMSVNVNYIHADMREMDFKSEFDRVLMMFTVLGYFSDDVNLKILAGIHRSLKPGGLLCFDVPNRDRMMKRLLPSFVTEKGNDFMIDQGTFDALTGRLYSKRTYLKDGKRLDASYSLRIYNFTEVKMILESVDFNIYKVFSSWDSSEFNHESPRLIIIAKKN